ncbi:ATPase [Anaerococcus degeneri]|uniref:ATPase n=1 Tax=Anaerococcus degeneri TaxID=361500 RepID=A0ABS7YWH3_9FIRM|nr:ATPase [Anaerococcus degeneri]MBP2015124.1 cell division septum initiation protein DivIVA [Anaerococcus degeneri]MCA2095384.1 ATPase [Anaerococcus degeneri]
MANKITDLILEMEDIMDGASSVPFSKKIAVDPDEIYEILNEMKDSLPEEIKQAQWVTDEKDRILSEASAEADNRRSQAEGEIKNFKEQAKSQYQKMVSEHELTIQARNEADRILQEAAAEAKKIRQQSYEYVDRLFTGSAANFSKLAQQLEQNKNKILENK